MYQVNRLFFRHNFAKHILRNESICQTPAKILHPLQSRSLLKVSGNDAPVFLQGLITNDMNHFEEGAKSMYAMFLNNKGRVLYDTLIHKWEGDDSFLLECDKNVHGLIQKHLKMFKLKRNVNIEDCGNLQLYALITSACISDVEVDTKINTKNDINVYKDPRLPDLGHRVLASININESHLRNTFGDNLTIANDETDYKYLRYKLGVSEGAKDLTPGANFPLEANCDYLHGVSFHKGCYIGQEVTARVHHTGVVRKRIMPLLFTDTGVTDRHIEIDSVISTVDNKKSNLGKFRSLVGDHGLGLVRIKEALEAKVLKIGKYTVEVVKPSWWPIEAPKEKASAKLEQ